MSDTSKLRSLIAAVRRRWFAQVALCNAGRALALAALPVFAALAVDYAVAPEGGPLVLLAAATLVASLAAAAIPLWRMQRRPDDRHVARFIEERAAGSTVVAPLDDAVVSAVEVAERADGTGASPFETLIVESAMTRLQGVDESRIIPAASIRRAALQATGGVALLASGLWLGGPGLARAVDTARVRFFPATVTIDVLPGNSRVPAGSPLTIRAHVKDGDGTLMGSPASLTVSADGEEHTVRMVPAGEAVEYAFESVDRTFEYRVSAGSAVSSAYTVTALFAPRVERIDILYTYPSFTGLATREERDGGDIYAPAGTRVRLRIHTDKPAVQGRMTMTRSGRRELALRTAGERLLETELVLNADDSYRLGLSDSDGLRSAGDSEYFIRVMDDRPPDVRITRPSSDQSITPLEEVAIEARADDDYGISRFDLVYTVGGGRERAVPFDRISGTDIQRTGTRLLAGEDLGVSPGDVIAYYARARDIGRGKRPTEARSDIFFLEVKPFSEEFVEAQSQAGGGANSQQIESLVSAQKEIISATWNIERRTTAGMSADDIKQVARAQAELRERVEQMASRMNRGGRFRPPFRLGPEQSGSRQTGTAADPLAAAIEAMAKAHQQLDAQKPKDALPHEMAALNSLLEAQAQVRRREVSRQASSGGNGGSNRSGQDLSALFDRELQRQQRTNYETRSQVEERQDRDTGADSAADRIRDLARRQEDLSRQQSGLANSGLSAEERKRQLERLTREQNELGERAEELARQMARQRGNSSQQPGGQASGEQSGQGRQRPGGGMKDVSEQMRSAAGDLRRDNPAAASRNSGKAAEQLRRLEQQMRGADPGAARQAAGELQLEAQQVAQEQRRIAAEADRLDKGQGGSTDAARGRLADEKERLAGRVDELQRAIRDQARRDPKGAAATSLGEAAEELEQQRLGQRMRDSANDMRAGTGKQGGAAASRKSGTADTEAQIARALDRVVEKLGGGASAEARRLSDQLEQTGQIRERLNRLEQQMREAESQAAQAGRQGREGRQGSGGSSGDGQAGDLRRMQEEYRRELERARESLRQLARSQPREGAAGSTPEEHEFSRSAPGTEASKQDRSGWEALRKDVDLALEKYESGVSERLARKLSEDRLSAGGSDRVPEHYRRLIARYYESLARVKK
jgi:hypothetical protein